MKEEKIIEKNIVRTQYPQIAVIGGIHGHEPIGVKVIRKLSVCKVKKGALRLIVAHSVALKKQKRYLETDLNRSFPGKSHGTKEERLACKIKKRLVKSDFIFDIHATNSTFDELIIISKLNSDIKTVLKYIPIQKVAVIGKNVFGGKELISQFKKAFSLEYGPDKSGKNAPRAIKHMRQVLINLRILEGKRKIFTRKNFYFVTHAYKVAKNFKQTRTLRDFVLIKNGQLIGHIGKKPIYADHSFYPIFLGRGRYKKTLALCAKNMVAI